MVRFYPVRIITKKMSHVEIPSYRKSVGQN